MPQPGEGEILVKVAAAGVNRPDVVQRKGLYPPPPGVTEIPGLEIAGTVVARGAGVGRWMPGDEVTALVSGGGYAEYCVAHESHALPIPAGLTAIEAAAVPEDSRSPKNNGPELRPALRENTGDYRSTQRIPKAFLDEIRSFLAE